jgi:hypothetical protein
MVGQTLDVMCFTSKAVINLCQLIGWWCLLRCGSTLWYTYSFSTSHSFTPLKLIKPHKLLQNQTLHLILSIVTPSHHPGLLNGLVVILILIFLATFYVSKSTILHHRVSNHNFIPHIANIPLSSFCVLVSWSQHYFDTFHIHSLVI